MFTTAFTDPQGTAHKAAVFQVLRSEFSANTSETFTYSVDEGQGTIPTDVANFSLNYRMAYWPTQEAKDSGGAPYILIDPATYSMDFADYTLPVDVYKGLTAEQAAEEHCKREVIKVVE